MFAHGFLSDDLSPLLETTLVANFPSGILLNSLVRVLCSPPLPDS